MGAMKALDWEIRELRAEAKRAGDLAMALMCSLALAGREPALTRVTEVIADARAQED